MYKIISYFKKYTFLAFWRIIGRGFTKTGLGPFALWAQLYSGRYHMYWELLVLWKWNIQSGKCVSWKGSLCISVWTAHQMRGRSVHPFGWLMQTGVGPLVPLPVAWKRSPIKHWPLLWHIHNITRQRQGTISTFGKLGKQSYREKNKAILSLCQNIQNIVLFVNFLLPTLCLICQIHSLNLMSPNFS